MKPKNIGIIGGAGPLAGIYFLERILSISGKKYGCHRDSDFPQVFLISFPFSEMLSSNMNITTLREELKSCLTQLRKNGASILAIACNTLHAFLDNEDESNDLIHLPKIVGEEVSFSDIPLVLATTTSTQFGLHKQFFPCCYPDDKTQKKVDEIIDKILKGENRLVVLDELQGLLQKQSAKTIILGCTELSLLYSAISIPNKFIIDPLELAAENILKKAFQQ